ncbi:MAG: hypothetical protein WCD44_02585 [Candidatus Babeliales bacterium]
MHEIAFIHYTAIALIVGINSIGVGLGEGFSSITALESISRQPNARPHIIRTAIIGMALIETAAIMGLLIAFLLLFGIQPELQTWYSSLAEIGIALAICLVGFVIGIVSAWPVQAACQAITRQPFFSQRILGFMVMTQALIQTPLVAALIIALFIKIQLPDIVTISDSCRLIASGLTIGLGSIGPAIGLALFAKTAVNGLGINRAAYNKLFSFTLISEAIIETPVIFSLVVAIILLFIVPKPQTDNTVASIAFLAAGLCTGIGTLGPGISSGKTAAAACKQIAHNPKMHSTLSRFSIFAQGLIETCAIYAILISLMLILFV